MRIRVVTWNLHSCVGTDGRCDPGRVGAVLERLGADVVAVQEVDGRRPRVGGRDQLGYLGARLGMQALAGPNLHDARGSFGNGLLTRHAPERWARIDLSVASLEPRGAIEAHLPLGGTCLRVVATHLGLRASERARQIRVLESRLGCEGSGPATLLMGDFNEWRPLRLAGWGHFARSFARVSRLRSFPSRRPLLPLDRILFRPRAGSFEVRVVDDPLARTASDHLPVVADLELPHGPAGRAPGPANEGSANHQHSGDRGPCHRDHPHRRGQAWMSHAQRS